MRWRRAALKGLRPRCSFRRRNRQNARAGARAERKSVELERSHRAAAGEGSGDALRQSAPHETFARTNKWNRTTARLVWPRRRRGHAAHGSGQSRRRATGARFRKFLLATRHAKPLTDPERRAKVLADFVNNTGDPAFDGGSRRWRTRKVGAIAILEGRGRTGSQPDAPTDGPSGWAANHQRYRAWGVRAGGRRSRTISGSITNSARPTKLRCWPPIARPARRWLAGGRSGG